MSARQVVEIYRSLTEIRDCENGMCCHCIDVLVEHAIPMVEQLVEGYGQCATHGYVETWHRCTRYDGQPLSLLKEKGNHNDGSSDIS